VPRVIGIDPGTVSVDLCGLDDGQLFLERSLPTVDALASPATLIDLLEAVMPLDLVAGPSGYGLPLTAMRDLTEDDLRMACLAADGEPGGIGGLRSLMRAMGRSTLPAVVTPGVVHLGTVPAHRKVNRVDMGTADKVCAAVLAMHEQAERRQCGAREVSLILLELGGAFTAAVAVSQGQIVDGIGGTSGPIGARAAGALDGEVAFLADHVTKQLLFNGGAATVAGTMEEVVAPSTPRGRLAWATYLESAVKAVAALAVSVPCPHEVVLSGRMARVDRVWEEVARHVAGVIPGVPVHRLGGNAAAGEPAARGAALLADGLAGGAAAGLVDSLGIRDARGTALDHLYAISPAAACERLGISPERLGAFREHPGVSRELPGVS
jgi:predicted butyrate kinase (DUF1464 family)